MQIEPMAAVGLAGFGLILGSFASALSHRAPRALPMGAARSQCRSCGSPLTARDLVPLLSWLVGGGRCRHCGRPIGLRYPLIELTTALLVLLAAAVADTWAIAGALVAMMPLLVALAVADLETGLLPNTIMLAMLPFALFYRWSLDGYLVAGAIGALLGAGLSFALREGFRRITGRDGLGLGDVKFLGLAGLLLAPYDWPVFLMLAGGLGLPLGLWWRASGRGEAFPFGPALIGALLVCLLVPGIGAALLASS